MTRRRILAQKFIVAIRGQFPESALAADVFLRAGYFDKILVQR